MYCTRCGAQNSDDSAFCSRCGNKLVQPQAAAEQAQIPVTPLSPPPPLAAPLPATPLTPARKTNGLAIAALVLGVVGFIIPICTLPAIIMGAIALGQIKKEPATEGKGMALAGIICGAVALVLWIVFIALAIVIAINSSTTTTNSSDFTLYAFRLASLV